MTPARKCLVWIVVVSLFGGSAPVGAAADLSSSFESSSRVAEEEPSASPADSTRPGVQPRAERRLTQSRSGTAAGAIVGGVLGAGLFLLAGAYAEGMCDASDCEDITTPGYVALVLLGGVLGAGAGALLGSFIGSTIPDEKTAAIPSSPPPGRSASIPPANGTIASLTLLAGYSRLAGGSEAEGVHYGARLLSHRSSRLWFGVEAARDVTHPGVSRVVGDLVLRLSPESGRPYLIVDSGWYGWEGGLSLLGAGAGAGIDWFGRDGGSALGIEGRYHWTLQNEDENVNEPFVQVGTTARFSW